MSEHSHEHGPEHKHGHAESSVEAQHEGKKTPEVNVEHLEKQKHDMLEQAEKTIREEAEPSKDMAIETAEAATTDVPYTGREVKAHTYKHNMQRVRRQLSVPEKALSKLIHNPIVDQASEIGGKTVARPSGLLGGGFFALLATSIFVYYTRHNGVTYNYGVFIAFFVGGYVFGMAVELLWMVYKRAKNS